MSQDYEAELQELLEDTADTVTFGNAALTLHATNPTGYGKPDSGQLGAFGASGTVVPAVGRTAVEGGGQPGVPRPGQALGHIMTGEVEPLDIKLLSEYEIQDIMRRCGGPGQRATRAVMTLAAKRMRDKRRREKNASFNGDQGMTNYQSTQQPLPPPQPIQPPGVMHQTAPPFNAEPQPHLQDAIQPPAPDYAPQPFQQQPQQMGTPTNQPVARDNQLSDGKIAQLFGIPFLGVTPRAPDVPAVWKLDRYGEATTAYHGVIEQDKCLILIYDTRYPVQPFQLSRSVDANDTREVDIDGMPWSVLVTNVQFQLGCLWFQVLSKVAPLDIQQAVDEG